MFPTTDVKQHCLCDFIDQEWEVNLGPEEESAIDGELLIMTRKKTLFTAREGTTRMFDQSRR